MMSIHDATHTRNNECFVLLDYEKFVLLKCSALFMVLRHLFIIRHYLWEKHYLIF